MRFRKYRLPKMKSDKLLSVLAIVLSVSLASCGKPDGEKIHLIADVTTRPGSGPVLLKGNRLFSDQRLFKQISEPLAIRVSTAAITEYDKVTDESTVYEDSKFESEVLPGV